MKLAYAVATPDTADPGMLALRGPPADSFHLLGALGYAGVDLMVRDPARLDAARLAAEAAASGLAIAAVSTGQARKEDGLELCHPDEAARTRAVDRGRAIVDLAAALGAAQVNVGTFRGTLREGPERPASLATARRSLGALAAHARAAGVRLAVEPQSRAVSNWLNTVAETEAFLDGFPSDAIGILLDLHHAALEEPSLADAIRGAAARRSAMVQVSDSDRLPPGRGRRDLGGFLRDLAEAGFEGFVSVEALQDPSPRAAAEQSVRHLRPLLDR